MSDTPKNRDDELREHLRQSAQDALGDWTFSPDMRAAVVQQVRQQQRVNTWAKAGRAARDAGWLVAAAAVVFMLASHNTGSAPSTPAAATQAPAAYGPMSGAAPTAAGQSGAASTATASSGGAANEPASQRAAQPVAPTQKTAELAQTNGPYAPTPAPAAPAATAQPSGTDHKVVVADSASTNTNPGTSTPPATGTLTVPNTPPTGSLKPNGTTGGGYGTNTIGLAATTTALVQTLPAPQALVSKPLITADLQAANQSGVALQALPGELLVYAKAGDTLLVRAFTPDLQSQWAASVDAQGVPILQTRGTLLIDRGILIWHDGEVTLRDLNGSQRQALAVGEGQQIRGLHMTGNRWLTIVGTTSGEPVAWLIDFESNRVVGLKLAHDTTDAVALDGTHVAALDAKSQLLLYSLPAVP